MSSINETSLRNKAFARLPSGFLTLAPVTSPSFPQQPVSRARSGSNEGSLSSRRSSTASTSTGPRVLKLGPVHWGEHLGEHKEDYYTVEEPVDNSKASP
ncbi:hypothetical protein HIM_03185 [Hirsutella minnesotensis 3608]|nr:hypothetical protein HIM_03185 [Hirsutella minnesotensis 3608]